jgi:hypothetical protein
MRRRWSAALLAIAGAAVTACSGTDPSSDAATSAGGTSPDSDVCAAADEVRASVDALGQVQVVQQGTDALRGALDQVREDVERLAEDAREEFGPQVDRVETSLDTVQDALETASADPSPGALGAAATAVGALVRDTEELLDEVSTTC